MHPYGPPGYPPPPRPPGAPKVFGTLSIVFGAAVGLMQLVGLASAGKPMFMPNDGAFPIEAFEEFHRATHKATLAMGLVMMAMSIALVVIGTGQLKYRRWAAGASVKWAIAAFVVLAVQAVVNFAILGPAMGKMMDEASGGRLPGLGGAMQASLFIGLIINAVYPTLLLVTFRKPHIVAAMSQ